MITNAANRIAARIPQLTPDELQAVLSAAISVLDEAACEEIGAAEDYFGPGVGGLNTLAATLGVPGLTPDEDRDL